MKKNHSLIYFCIFSFLLAGCSSMPSGFSRGGGQVRLRPYTEQSLSNGLKIIFIEDASLPRVNLSLLIKSGTLQESADTAGINNLTASLLDQGTAKMSAIQVADAFAELGSDLDIGANTDYTLISTSGLSWYRNRLLSLFVDCILNPAFSQDEIDRNKQQTLAAIQKMVDEPTAYADHLLDRELFKGHPYSFLRMGRPETVKKFSKTDIVKHYFRFYRPNNSILAVSGQFDEAFKAQVVLAFSMWQGKPIESDKLPTLTPVRELTYKLFSKTGLQQTQVRIGQLAIRRADPDFLKLRLANVVLGGSFASRLNQKVRDDLGLTYSISSALETRLDVGSYEINTFTRNDKVRDTVSNALAVYKDFQSNGITEKEFEDAKALMIGQFPASIETVDRLALNLMLLRLYGVPDSYLTNYIDNVTGYKLQDVNNLIKTKLSANQLIVAVYADQAKIGSQLSDFKPLTVEKP